MHWRDLRTGSWFQTTFAYKITVSLIYVRPSLRKYFWHKLPNFSDFIRNTGVSLWRIVVIAVHADEELESRMGSYQLEIREVPPEEYELYVRSARVMILCALAGAGALVIGQAAKLGSRL